MLDSGAFSFIQNSKRADWDEYVRRYIEYIKAVGTRRFFELDIDGLIGYARVKEIRRRIEREVATQSIPVWHKRLGVAEFLRMCDEYSYVAIGGIVSRKIMKSEYKYFPWFINEAYRRDAKIHGLGFTNLEGLMKYHFDSVNSTAWTSGTRFGVIYRFNGKTLERKYIQELWSGKRLKMFDSGAFTDYINQKKVSLFFELDIDNLVGYEKVKEIWRKLKSQTGKTPITAWHKRLGISEFLNLCEKYDYVAVGGIANKEIIKSECKYFPYLERRY